MEQISHRFNPDYFYTRSQRELDGVSKEECIAWFNHPCTKCLREALEGDIAGIVSMWLAGAYSNEESSETTSQRQAKARGMAQAAENMLAFIRDIKAKSLQGDEIEDDTGQ